MRVIRYDERDAPFPLPTGDEILLSGDEQSGTDKIEFSGDMAPGNEQTSE